MNWLKHFQKYQRLYTIGALILFFVINALTLATSRIMEDIAVEPNKLPFALWEPFLWEFSSAAVVLALVPAVHKLLQSKYVAWETPILTIVTMALGSIVFSLLHVSGMIAIRELFYWLANSDYRFGPVLFGFLYEYRKDLLTFIVLIIVIKGYKFIVSRLRGEADLVVYGEDKPTVIDHILVKKLGKEFIVKIRDIDWMESSGNYVNLYVDNRIYPTRDTMTSLIKKLEELGLCRIHRSFGVSLDRVSSIENLENGNANVKLLSGKTLPVSRRYKEELKRRLAAA